MQKYKNVNFFHLSVLAKVENYFSWCSPLMCPRAHDLLAGSHGLKSLNRLILNPNIIAYQCLPQDKENGGN